MEEGHPSHQGWMGPRILLVVIYAVVGWEGVDGRACKIHLNPSKREGLYTATPEHIEPITTCDLTKPQRSGKMDLHVMVSHNTEKDPPRGVFCSGLRSSLFYNVRMNIYNVKLGTNNKGWWTAACDKTKQGNNYKNVLVCKTWGWLQLAKKVKDDNSYILIHDSDFVYGGGVDKIVEAYRATKVDLLMGTEARCALPIFNNLGGMQWKGTKGWAGCKKFWAYQWRKGDPPKGQAYFNSGFVMGRADHVKTWLKLVTDMTATSTHNFSMGDQSFFALAYHHQRAGQPGETWEIKHGAVKGFKGMVLPFTVGIDYRKMAFVMADTDLGWQMVPRKNARVGEVAYSYAHPAPKGTPANETLKNAKLFPTVFLHWAGIARMGKQRMICDAEMLNHEGACLPAELPICLDGRLQQLRDVCPTQWTRGCKLEPEPKYLEFRPLK